MKYIVLMSLIFLAGCAQVGPIAYDTDEPWFIVPALFVVAMLFFAGKGYIEYVFAKRLERYKKKLEKE